MRSLVTAALTATALLASPAIASAAQYRAVPAAQPERTSYVTRDTLWKCTDDACVAGSGRSRPEVMCERIVKHVGKLTEFTAEGSPLDAKALAKCNARAR
ncbi:CC_3452 family protein [Stakelama marina]|uniref:Uncharacterized protein n=1 Tax=Stakelama marina TaxID=2826939 RepID=A0A8T4ICS7_9SPHN|nr:hypothetical protein [Stakelama marina]MBR0552447.1 hypothetical protein [Stakelama marina]